MALAYLQIFADKEELLEPFDDAERGRLLTAMLAYALHDEEPLLTGNERYIWPVFRQMIDQSKAALLSKQAAGRARQSSSDQQEASRSQQKPAAPQQEPAASSSAQQEEAEDPIIQESGFKNQESGFKNRKGERKRTRFTPPTTDQVIAYAREAGLIIDAQRFCDFYIAKGWRVGSTPMENWQAAVRSWCAREQLPPNRGGPVVKVTEAQQYSQREYKHSDAAVDAMMAEFQRRGEVS